MLLTPGLHAQTVQDEIAFTRAQIQADRQAIVAATLGLTEAQGEVFWPLYREYRGELEAQGDRMWKLLVGFGEKYDSLSDTDAASILDEWLSIKKKEVAIKDKWVKKFSKAVGAATTARFYQIENKLDSIIQLEATAGIPLAKPAD
jgi:hypothetical protein